MGSIEQGVLVINSYANDERAVPQIIQQNISQAIDQLNQEGKKVISIVSGPSVQRMLGMNHITCLLWEKPKVVQIEQTKQGNTLNETIIPSDDSFEAIKKYKELLDLGIISQEDFDEKRKELLDRSNAASFVSASFAEEETMSYSVELVDFDYEDGDYLTFLEEMCEILNCDMSNARNLVRDAPAVIIQGLSKPNANEIGSRLEALGATIDIQSQ